MEKISRENQNQLLQKLELRFSKNMQRHPDMYWADVHNKLSEMPEKIQSLWHMEASGGEPDVVQYQPEKGRYLIFDCSRESPKGRRSLCYDREALLARKKFPPAGNALDEAEAMGIRLLNEQEYRYLQALGAFDTKTSSWIATPDPVRDLGGALFGDYRYARVFIYHNGADSYYAARGFRGVLEV